MFFEIHFFERKVTNFHDQTSPKYECCYQLKDIDKLSDELAASIDVWVWFLLPLLSFKDVNLRM